MTTTVAPAMEATSRRPASAATAIAILWFLGITAVGGGIGFFLDLGMRDPAWLDEIPLVTNWVLPGLVLGIGFGLGSMFTAIGVTQRPRLTWLNWLENLTKHHWSWFGTLLLGLGMMTWIGLQLIWIDLSFLHVIYGIVGILLVGIAATGSFRRYLAR
jgi:hypothetical protein